MFTIQKWHLYAHNTLTTNYRQTVNQSVNGNRGASNAYCIIFFSLEFQHNVRHLHNENNKFSEAINAIGCIDETVESTIAKVQQLT